MKSLIFVLMCFTASFLSGQQTEGLKTEKTAKTSILERRLPSKSNDSIAKHNLNDILKQNNSGGNSVFGTANPYHSEIQTNVNRLNNNVNSFNNNVFNRLPTQGEGIQFNKKK